MHLLDTPVKIVRDVISGVCDLIYPPVCLGCGQAGNEYLCAKCIEKIDVIKLPFCRKCGSPCESSICFECKTREYVFECACGAGIFEGVLREAIHAFKYKNHIMLADPFAEIMARCLPNTHLAAKVDLVMPIPIHSSRKLERGFDQAVELTRRFCRLVSLPAEYDVLYKHKKTRHQVELSLELRAINLAGAFRVRNAEKIRGKRILLIDDVFTTGATLNEAARTLLDAGAKSVRGYMLARSI